MTNEEKAAMKAACVQAAATLVAASWHAMRNGDFSPSRAALDGNAVECARIAHLLYVEMSANHSNVLAKTLPTGSTNLPLPQKSGVEWSPTPQLMRSGLARQGDSGQAGIDAAVTGLIGG
jgi:hypothetical protein